MTLAIGRPHDPEQFRVIHPAGGPITLNNCWPHGAEQFSESWPHEVEHWHRARVPSRATRRPRAAAAVVHAWDDEW